MSGGCIHTPVHKYDCWNHVGGACIEKHEDICRGCLSMARTSGFDQGETASDLLASRAYYQAWREALDIIEDALNEARERGRRGFEIAQKQALEQERDEFERNEWSAAKERKP